MRRRRDVIDNNDRVSFSRLDDSLLCFFCPRLVAIGLRFLNRELFRHLF